MFNIIINVSPLVIIPYVVLALFVISYFAYLKYLIRKEIKNIPTAIYNVDVKKLKMNLQIKSMVYNFILIISVIEFFTNIMIETDLLIRPSIDAIHENDGWINLSNSCRVDDMDLKILGMRSTFFYSRTRNIAEVVFSEVPILMALFYIILRRMYLNVSYHRHIRKYIIYIVLQFVVKCVLNIFIQTFNFGALLYLPFGLIDFAIYILASQKFYALLKGMRNAASLHSTKYEYFERKRVVRRFFYAQVVTISVLLLLLMLLLTSVVQVSFQVVTGCFLSYITLDYIPSITVSEQLIEQMIFSFVLTKMAFLFIAELIILALYLGLTVDIILKLVRKRTSYNNKNFLITRPLMEKYRKSLFK